MISRQIFPRRRASLPKVCAAAFIAASLAAGGSAFGQNYSTNFDGTPATYTNGGSLSGQNGWDTNDAARASNAEDVGQSDYVGQITYGTGSNIGAFSGYQGAVGGLYHGTVAPTQTVPSGLPGAPIVYVYHPFTSSGFSSYTLNTDFDLSFPTSGTTTGTPNTTRDSFGFNFQTSGLANLFSVNFTPDATNPNQMIIGYSVNGVQTIPPTPGASAVTYNSVYHLRLQVNATTMTIIVSSSTNTFTLSNIALNGVTPASVQQVAATWTLKTTTAGTIDANGGYTQAGSNALIFDNFSVVVPEPSTWAMLGLGVLALGVYARRRVRV